MNTMAPGWHTATVAPPTEIILALQGSFGAAFWKPLPIRRDLVDHPVDKGLLCGRIWIVADDRYLLGPLGKSAPLQGRGDILPLSRVLLRDGSARFESGARHFYSHYLPPSRGLLCAQIREFASSYSLTAVPEALTMSMLPPCASWIDS